MEEGSMLLNPNLIEKNDRLIVAVSGGVDSDGYARLLNNLKDKLNLFLVVVHINHHKREAANMEMGLSKTPPKSLAFNF